MADRAFDCDGIHDELLDRDIAPCIPSRSNRAKPVDHDGAMSRQRNRVDRLVGKLKQFRRVATRYEKLGDTFPAVVHLASAFMLTG
jgi:transposase